MKRILLALATLSAGCICPSNVPRPSRSNSVTAAVVAVSVLGIGFVAASGSQGPP